MKSVQNEEANHIAPIDGLRAIAFLLVLIHHLPYYDQTVFFKTANAKGWVGVELFFVISTYLFFVRLPIEWSLTGKISISNFYIRRLLRIYPLLLAFVVGSMIVFGFQDQTTPFRAAGLLLFIDNVVTVLTDRYSSVFYSAPLWTLSLEFQVYLLVPVTFLLYRAVGGRVFGWILVAVAIYCTLARFIVVELGGAYPAVWVLPFFRPESILAGIALATYRPQWHWAISVGITIAAGCIFILLPNPFEGSKMGMMAAFPMGAVMFASLVDASLRSPLRRVLSFRPWAYLGRISYGLYVFHLIGVSKAKEFLEAQGFVIDLTTGPAVDALYFATTLAITISLASVSYYLLEKPIDDRFKHKFSALASPPIA